MILPQVENIDSSVSFGIKIPHIHYYTLKDLVGQVFVVKAKCFAYDLIGLMIQPCKL